MDVEEIDLYKPRPNEMPESGRRLILDSHDFAAVFTHNPTTQRDEETFAHPAVKRSVAGILYTNSKIKQMTRCERFLKHRTRCVRCRSVWQNPASLDAGNSSTRLHQRSRIAVAEVSRSCSDQLGDRNR
jgi:hypothetical protein